jgi:hypothetical protein
MGRAWLVPTLVAVASVAHLCRTVIFEGRSMKALGHPCRGGSGHMGSAANAGARGGVPALIRAANERARVGASAGEEFTDVCTLSVR